MSLLTRAIWWLALAIPLSRAADPAPAAPAAAGKIEFSRVSALSAPLRPGVAHGDAEGGFERAFAILKHAIESAEQAEVFEGLPHSFEKEVLAAEKQKPTRRFDDEWFYAEPQPMSAEVRRELEVLLLTPALKPYAGMKACGGFHADYAVRWRWHKGEKSALLLICFGCSEARVVSGGRWTSDLIAGDKAKLQKIFAAFRRLRPEPVFSTAAKPPNPP